MADLYLASTSPRRSTLLTQIGVEFSLLPVEVDETPLANESPADFVLRVATAKALQGAAQLTASDATPILGADTAVVVDQQILGKPASEIDATRMLRSLAGREHRVLTAVVIVSRGGQHARLSETRVTLRPLNDQQIADYIATGEPEGKAGGYAVQGIAAAFISTLQGSYSGVMGLPLQETSDLLIELDIPFALNPPAPSPYTIGETIGFPVP